MSSFCSILPPQAVLSSCLIYAYVYGLSFLGGGDVVAVRCFYTSCKYVGTRGRFFQLVTGTLVMLGRKKRGTGSRGLRDRAAVEGSVCVHRADCAGILLTDAVDHKLTTRRKEGTFKDRDQIQSTEKSLCILHSVSNI